MRNIGFARIGYILGLWSAVSGLWPVVAVCAKSMTPLQSRVVAEASSLLEEYQVSYAYGGNRLGTAAECEACNLCLDKLQPRPKQRFKKCPACYHCSLDCSHFTQLVWRNSGLFAPYLTTKTMLELTARDLMRSYRLVDLGRRYDLAQPGDLLVYRGHVVLLVMQHGDGRGDIIHATGGKDIRAPGQGIQKERQVPLASFRGPLLRVLRHSGVALGQNRGRLRPVPKK